VDRRQEVGAQGEPNADGRRSSLFLRLSCPRDLILQHMSATIHSLPPEVVLQILYHLAPIEPEKAGGRAALLAASLVDRRLGQLSQQVLFRSVHLERRSYARRWRATAARVYTREMTISWWPEWMVSGAGKAFRPLPLAELLAPCEVHAAAGACARISMVNVQMIDHVEVAGSLAGVEMLEGESGLGA
jgi:hypothetical protein